MATRKQNSLEKFKLYFEELPSMADARKHMKSYKKTRKERDENNISR